MTSAVALLRSCSWHAEKLLKQRGNFNSVLWLTEHADGHREMRETWCDNAPAEANDAEILAHLADEMRAEFAASGAARFAVSYLANRITTSRPVEQIFLLQASTYKRCGVMIEGYSADEHWRTFREIVWLNPRQPTLGAICAPEPAGDSLYESILIESTPSLVRA